MTLGSLTVGSTFRAVYNSRPGEVVGQGDMGTRVRWAGSGKKVRIVKKARYKDEQDKVAEFDAPARVEVISSSLEVEQLSGNHLVGATEVGAGSV